MSESAIIQLPLTTSQALDRAAELVKSGLTPAEAADRVLAENVLADEAVAYFLREGFRSAVNLSKHRHVSAAPDLSRTAAREARRTFSRFQPRWAHGHELQSALDAMFQGAHGRMKPLADFRREDWQELLHAEIAQVRGHVARAKVIREALMLLDRYVVGTARELPPNPARELEAAVAGAWRR